MKIYEFDAVIIKHDSIDATFIEFPFNVEQEFGVKGQVKVKATFDGYEYRGSLASMAHPCHCLGITQKIRKEINKQAGDMVHVVIIKDDAARVVELTEDFRALLEENHEAKNTFNSLSYINQKKLADWIAAAKKIETRNKRLEDAVAKLIKK
jgi:hypothetical protein